MDIDSKLSLEFAEREALQIVHEAIETYNPSHVFGLFSGGHDSLCACHVASRQPGFSGCIHINTGIGVEETRQFVRETCKEHGWVLHEYKPPTSYEELCIDQGFPGPAMHWKMYQRLKERCLAAVLRDFKDPRNRRRKIVFVSGRRKQESVRRMANVIYPIETDQKHPSPRVVWCNPLMNWSKNEKHHYIEQHSLKRNPVVETLCMSGECLCGAFAKPGEYEEIRKFYPAAADEIDRIAEKVKAAGKHCQWGTAPPSSKYRPMKNQMELPLCVSCQAKFESR